MFQLALITIGKWFCFSLCLGRKGNWKLLGSKIFLAKVIIIHNTTCSSGNCKTLQRNRKDLFFVTLPKGQNNIARSYTLSLCQSNKIMLQGANFFSLFQGNKEMFLWRPPPFFSRHQRNYFGKKFDPLPLHPMSKLYLKTSTKFVRSFVIKTKFIKVQERIKL